MLSFENPCTHTHTHTHTPHADTHAHMWICSRGLHKSFRLCVCVPLLGSCINVCLRALCVLIGAWCSYAFDVCGGVDGGCARTDRHVCAHWFASSPVLFSPFCVLIPSDFSFSPAPRHHTPLTFSMQNVVCEWKCEQFVDLWCVRYVSGVDGVISNDPRTVLSKLADIRHKMFGPNTPKRTYTHTHCLTLTNCPRVLSLTATCSLPASARCGVCVRGRQWTKMSERVSE
jgi:hypothetical protein